MNVTSMLAEGESLYGDRPMMYFRDQSVSFAGFHAQVRRWIEVLKSRGVRPRDRVVLLAVNRPGWLACYFAVLARGAVLVPLNPALTPSEVAYIVDDSTPVLAIVDQALAHKLDDARHRPAIVEFPESPVEDAVDARALAPLEWLDVEPAYPAIIFYTSGTTGRPKGAVLSHASTWSSQQRFAQTVLGATRDDRVLIVGSFAFIMHSSISALSHIGVGATVVLHERFHPQEALEAIAHYRVTSVTWVPTMYVMALEWAESHPTDLSSLRVCISGGAVLPWTVVERFESKFGKRILNAWGMTEGTPITTFGVDGRGRPESIGRVMPGCELKVIDDAGNEVPDRVVGQLVFRSASNMMEYYNRPDATAEALRDGWMMSGDLGWRDEEGYFYLSGRIKDMIIRGGAKIYPVEVEEVLNAHASVAGCAVVGKADERFGESVIAFVQPRDGRHIDATALLAHCTERLAPYKVPQEIVEVGEFPLGPTGKVLKRVLRDRLDASEPRQPQ